MLTLDELKKNAQERKNVADQKKNSDIDEIRSKAIQLKEQRANVGWSNFAKRYQNEIDSYAAGANNSLWGKQAAEIQDLQAANMNRVSTLLREAETYRSQFGNDTTDSVLQSLTDLKNAYSSIYDNAEIYSQYKSEEEYLAQMIALAKSAEEEQDVIDYLKSKGRWPEQTQQENLRLDPLKQQVLERTYAAQNKPWSRFSRNTPVNVAPYKSALNYPKRPTSKLDYSAQPWSELVDTVSQMLLSGEDRGFVETDLLLNRLEFEKGMATERGDGKYAPADWKSKYVEFQGYYNELVTAKNGYILSKVKMDDSNKSVLQELQEVAKLSGDEKKKRKEAVLKKMDELGINREDYAIYSGDKNYNKKDFWSWLKSTVDAGANQFFSGVAKTLNATFGEVADWIVGDDNFFDDVADYWQGEVDNSNFNQEFYADQMGGGKVLDFFGDTIETSVSILPDIFLAIATSGTSAAASATGSAAKVGGTVATQSLAKRATWEAASSVLTKASITASNIVKKPQFWTSFVRTYGNDYEQAVAGGASEEVATFYATITSFLNAGIEIGVDGGSGFQGLPDALKSGDKSKILAWTESTLQEVGEEGLQKTVNELATVALYDHDADILNPKEYAYEMGVAAASTGIMGGGQVAIDAAANTIEQQVWENKNAKNIYGDAQQELVGEALEIEPANAYAQRMQGRLDNGKDLSGRQLNRLVQQNNKALTAQDMATIQGAVESRLTELGETGDVAAIAKALAKQAKYQSDYNNAVRQLMADGYTEAKAKKRASQDVQNPLSRSEKSLIANSKYGQRVANELSPDNIQSDKYSAEWAQKLDTQRINVEEYSRLVEAAQQPQTATETTGEQIATEAPKAAQVVQPGAVEAPAATVLGSRTDAEVDASPEAVAEDETFQKSTGKAVQVKRFSSVGKDTKVVTQSGNDVKLSDVSVGNENEALLLQTIPTFGHITTEAANVILQSYRLGTGNVSSAGFIEGAAHVFKSGYYNSVPATEYSSRLTDTQRDLIYEAGRKAAQDEADAAQAARDAQANGGVDRSANKDYDGVKNSEPLSGQNSYSNKAALLAYKSGGSYTLNAKLREGMELSREEQDIVEGLDDALPKLPAYKGTVYRNIIFDDFGDQDARDAFVADHTIGEIVTYIAYTSASTRPDGYVLEGNHLVHLIIDSVNGRNMEGYGNNFESEVLFSRDSSFIANKIIYDTDGTPTIYLTEVANETSASDRGRNQRELSGGYRGQQKTPAEAHQSKVQRLSEKNSWNGKVQSVSERDSEENSSESGGLSGVQAEVSASDLDNAAQKSGKQAQAAPAPAKKGGVFRGYDGQRISKNSKGLTKKQRITVDFTERLAKRFGATVYFYESYVDENGKRVYKAQDGSIKAARKGFYNPKDGSIHIDLNGDNLLFTVSHELVHFIKDWSPARFKKMADIIMAGFGKQGITAEELIANKQAEYAEDGIQLTEDEAFEEVIAASLEGIMADGRVMELLQKLEAEDKGLKAKAKKFFQDIGQMIRDTIDSYRGVKPDSAEGRLIQKMEDIYSQLQELFAESVYDAGETFRETENTTGEGGVRYSAEAENVIDLSLDNELSARVSGLYGAPKYKVIQQYILEVLAEQPITLSDGKKAIVDKSDALHIANKSGTEKTSQIANIRKIVESAVLYAQDPNAEHKKFDQFWYYKAIVQFKGEKFPLFVNVGKAKNDGSFHIYDITKKIRDTADRINGLERPKQDLGYALESDTSTKSIRKSEKNVNKNLTTDSDEGAGVRYAVGKKTDKAAQEMLEKENAKLREDVAQLKELLRLQGKQTHGTKFTASSVEAAARYLKKNAGAKGDTKALAKMLNEFYEYIARGEDLTWEALREKARPIAEWLMDHVDLTGTELLEYAQNWRLNEQDLIRDIYDSYWRVNNLRTVADRNAAQVNKLKGQHFQRINKLKADNRQNAERLKEQHRAEVKFLRDAYRQNLEAQQKELLAEYRKQRKEDVEKRKAELAKYGTIPQGEKPVRKSDLPKSTDGENKVSRTARTVYEAGVTPEDFAELIDDEVYLENGLSYVPISNNDATQNAIDYIMDEGWEAARGSWSAEVRRGKVSAELSAMGALLLNNAAKAGDKQTWLDILHDYQIMSTNAGQAVQALRILKTLTPDDRLYMVHRSISRMVKDLRLKRKIQVDAELEAAYLAAETDKDRDDIMALIQQDVADQIPATFSDKWTSLRYLNMLGSLRTQKRNLAGNTVMGFTTEMKNVVAAGLESIASICTGGRYQKNKALFAGTGLMKAAFADYALVKSIVSDGGKYNDHFAASSDFARGVMEKRRIFKNKVREGYRKVTNWAMENGDMPFSKYAYARALAGYLKQHGFNGSDLSKADVKLLEEARQYAVQEAQEATFHDMNVVSKALSKRYRGNNMFLRIVNAGVEGVMPFRKTPANIAVRAEEYSPLGVINSLYYTVQAARENSDITPAQAINSWAKTITGSALFLIGSFLAASGYLIGGPDDDEDREQFEQMYGQQNYALKFGDTYITIDWASPAAIPMLMGAQFYKLKEENGFQFKDITGALSSLADPLIEMSMLQGINDALENVRYSDNNLIQLAINSGLGYFTQGITNTLLGQTERSFEDSRMSTYVDANSPLPKWMQQQLGKISAKTPGWDYNQVPYIDAWGEEQENPKLAVNAIYNMLSPSYISRDKRDAVYEELMRLDDAQSDKNVFPSTPEKEYEGRYLSADEYVALAKAQGQTQRKLVEEIIATEEYKAMNETNKAKAISFVYKYAKEKAQIDVLGRKAFSAKWLNEIQGNATQAIIQHVLEQ